MNNVFNSNIGTPYDFFGQYISHEGSEKILAELFEQYLIFDCVTVAVGRENTQLEFLIKNLGLSAVDQLLSDGSLKFCLWTPLLVTTTGKAIGNGRIDTNAIYGKPPFSAGTWGEEDLDAEKNIRKALDRFSMHDLRKKQFLRKASEAYIIPDGMEFSKNAAEIVFSAYENNALGDLGMPYYKEPSQMNLNERKRFMDLGYKVLETAILSEYKLKSYENYEAYKICESNLSNIGKAYNISENTSEIFRLNNLPDLKKIYLTGKMDFLSAFRIREYGTAKYYRDWINKVGENSNSYEVTKAYIDEIEGKNKFFESKRGRFIKNLVVFGVGGLLGEKISEQPLLGSAVAKVGEYALGLFDEFILNNLTKGKNPSMFIKEIDYEISPPATLYNGK